MYKILNDKVKKINDFYNSFFAECKKIDRCGQSKYNTNKKEEHCYNHGLIFTKNFFDSKNRLLIIGQERKEESQSFPHTYIFDSKMTRHWRGTLITVIKIFNKIQTEEIKGINVEKIGKLLNGCDFAFTNYYKCGFSINGNFSGDMIHNDLMIENCGICLKKEIELLRPKLIIKQGVTIPSIEKLFDKHAQMEYKENRYKNCKMFECEYSDGEKFYIINSYHPSRYWWWRTLKVFCEMIDYYNTKMKQGGI